MRRYGLLLLLLAPVALQAASYINFEQIAVTNTAVGFTAATITPPGQPQAQTATCRARTAEMSYRVDGGTATTTVGTLIEIGDVVVINGHDSLVRFSAVRTTSTSGQLDCTVSAP